MYTSVFSLFQNPVLHSLKSEGTTIPIQSFGKVSRNSCHSFQHNQDFVFYVNRLKTTALHQSGRMKDCQASLENCCKANYNMCRRRNREASASWRPDRDFLTNWSHELIFSSICQNQTLNFGIIAFRFTSTLLAADTKLSQSKLYGKGSMYTCPKIKTMPLGANAKSKWTRQR